MGASLALSGNKRSRRMKPCSKEESPYTDVEGEKSAIGPSLFNSDCSIVALGTRC